MKFLIDNQLPFALAKSLQEAGHETRHVLDLALDEAPDREIVRYASENGFVIVTKDEDFSVLAALGRCRAPVIWVRLGNCRTDTLIRAFSAALEALSEKISAGEVLIELHG